MLNREKNGSKKTTFSYNLLIFAGMMALKVYIDLLAAEVRCHGSKKLAFGVTILKENRKYIFHYINILLLSYCTFVKIQPINVSQLFKVLFWLFKFNCLNSCWTKYHLTTVLSPKYCLFKSRMSYECTTGRRTIHFQ